MQKQNKPSKEKKRPRGKPFEKGHGYGLIYREPMVVVRLSVAVDQKKKLKEYCDLHDIKASALIRDLIEDFLKSLPEQ